MKLDGSAVQYLLSQMFDRVSAAGVSGTAMFDYPILYDETADMSGHVVLIPAHELPYASENLRNALLVCVGEPSIQAAKEVGLPAIIVRDEVTFQHLYNKMQSAFVRNDRMDAQLRAYVSTHAGFQPLLETCSNALNFPCLLIDEHYRIICRSSLQFDDTDGISNQSGEYQGVLLEPEIVDLYMASRNYQRMRMTRSVFAVPGSSSLLMKNVFQSDKLVGTIVMQHEGSMLSARFARFLLNYLISFVEEMYVRIGSFGSEEIGRDYARAAIRNIEAGEVSGYSQLEIALEEAGFASGRRLIVARIERSFTNEGPRESSYLARRFELALPRACCFFTRGGLFLLHVIPDDLSTSEGTSLVNLPIVARDNLSKVGVSRPFSSVHDLQTAIVQADAALEGGSNLDPTNWVYRFDDVALPWLVKRACAGVSPSQVCHEAITTLARYDEIHNASLLDTLHEFARSRYNATAASEALFVARSTLLNRLERIVELTGIDLEDYEERTYIALSFAMMDASHKV